jgi:cytochrome c554/c'-like protein
MVIKTLTTVSVLAMAVFTTVILAQDPATPQAPGYAWADSCRTCHPAIYDAWAKTKHATALDRLSGGDQEKECIGCHVTGPKTRVSDGKKVLNRGIQCEACHGGSAAHAADPKVKSGLGKMPASALCEECHSDKGPHFRGFWFDAMKSLVHKTK